MRRILLTSAALAMTCTGGIALAKHHENGEVKQKNEALHSVLMHERRAKDKARDKYRNPGKTLSFLGVKPTDTVVEYAPGGGWYARVIAPYVVDQGQYMGLVFSPEGLPIGDGFRKRLLEGPTTFPKAMAEATGKDAARFPLYLSDNIPDAAKGTADYVIIPRMMHNLYRWNAVDREIKAARSLLKDGGKVGIIQHRAKDTAPFSYANGTKGYLRTDTVVKLMEAHGFELVKQSEINANPKDTADYPKGVWTLPPRYAEGDTDKAKYTEIGESDRMTLLFKKLN